MEAVKYFNLPAMDPDGFKALKVIKLKICETFREFLKYYADGSK